jgi:hypothetical protein
VSVGHRLLRGERLAGDEKQRPRRVGLSQRFGQVRAIHVTDEVQTQISLGVGFECLAHHDGAEIATADANVDDIGNRFAGVSFPCSRANQIAKSSHVLKNSVDLGHDILTVNENRTVTAIA